MQIDHRQIGAIQPVNALGSFAAGRDYRAVEDQRNRDAAYRNALATHGAGAMQGDQNALAQLAQFEQFGPQAGMQMRATQQQMRISEEQLQMARQRAAREAEAQAASMSAEQRQQYLDQMERGAQMGLIAQSPEQWAQALQVMGMTPDEAPFEAREMVLAGIVGASEVFEAREAMEAGPEDNTPASFQALSMRATEAGLAPGTPEYQQFMLQGGRASDQLRIETRADGTTVVTQGDPSAEQESRMDPSSTAAMIASIDGILNDPALDRSTGMFSVLQNVPGTPQRRFGARARQLEGQAFLQAFESLKGAGQITEIEGQKATQAIGRLDTAQSADDYRTALTELRDILSAAQQRPLGWADTQAAEAQQPAPQSDWRATTGYGGQTTFDSDAPGNVDLTPSSIAAMPHSALTEALRGVDVSSLPDDVLQAIIEKGQ